uniref:Uncharacterized protein n=1 Tax=Alexandrium monilatum TaxID=311494 RepID=A0A7S4VXQ0_9DINO
MVYKLACPWPAVLAAVLALAPPSAAAVAAGRASEGAAHSGRSSLRWSSQSLAAKEPEPTPDEAGLFGPPFKVPLLRVDTGDVAADVQMQLAVTPAEQHHGLMFRRSLQEELAAVQTERWRA